MNSEYVIELRDVAIYHARRGRAAELALSGVDLGVRHGELLYLIGRVGSGKSTLLKMLYGEVPLGDGMAYVAGYDLRRLRRRDIPHLRRRMGVVFQDCQLLTDRNVFANLHYVMKATGWRSETDMRRRVEELLALVGLANKEYKMPYELSGGEQQRLAIARALINAPEVIIADEPTGNLDPTAADAIMQIFSRIAQMGCAVVMATHNLNLIADYPSRTVRFAQGKVEEIDITKR
ncbi:MAG: ATP-binding cassette domain-containing protein [Rikenellaceae bacterium]|nr:ATP-binding cassette domain-containing protein [Rikenellaceae bacterium]MCL2691903.1 ATP-binding cassette domain-containing protein [Rikenellaceae bacterium]